MALEQPLLAAPILDDKPPLAAQQTMPSTTAAQLPANPQNAYYQPATQNSSNPQNVYYQPPTQPSVNQPQAFYQPATQPSANPQFYYQVPQGNVALNPVQYVPLSNYQTPTVAVTPPPNYNAPPDFLVLAIVTTSICAFLVLVSLFFGIPAVILSVLSSNAKSDKNYAKAKDYGKYSLLFTIINIVFTLIIALLVIGLTTGFIVTNSLYACNYDYYSGTLCRYSYQ